MECWDPVGVCGAAFATDEYESYVPKTKALLRAGAPVDTLIDYLDRIATDGMGLTSERECGRQAAEKLLPLALLLTPLM